MTTAAPDAMMQTNTDEEDIGFDAFRFDRTIDALLEQGARPSPETVWLDLGCHQGQLLRRVIRRFGVKGIGFDDWPAALKSAADARWQYFQANLDKELPWRGEADVVSALEVLEHMVDTDGFLDRILAILKPGGYLVLSTPNINSLRNRITVPLGIYPTGLEYRTVIHHVRLYNPQMLREHLSARGFVDIRMRGVSFLPVSRGLGTSALSEHLATRFPALCANVIAVARRAA